FSKWTGRNAPSARQSAVSDQLTSCVKGSYLPLPFSVNRTAARPSIVDGSMAQSAVQRSFPLVSVTTIEPFSFGITSGAFRNSAENGAIMDAQNTMHRI